MLNEEQQPITRQDLRELKTGIIDAINNAINQSAAQLRAEINEAIDKSAAQLRAEMKEAIDQSAAQSRAEMKEAIDQSAAQLRADTQEFVRDAQTEILRGYHASEEYREVRFSRLKAEVSIIDQESNGRIDNIEKRLVTIEKKLLFDPPRHQ